MTDKLRLSQAEIDEANALSTFQYALRKETPGKFWATKCLSPVKHPSVLKAICKALSLDPDDPAILPAIRHIHVGKPTDSEPYLVIPYPIPLPKLWPDGKTRRLWLEIEQVLIWNPANNHVEIMGDKQAQLYGTINRDLPETHKVWAHVKPFLQAWASALAIQDGIKTRVDDDQWAHPFRERDVVPGALIIGKPDKIRWPIQTMPDNIKCVGIDAKIINHAILKSARLPWASNA